MLFRSENSYRAVTIAFMEEWARFAESVGVDLFSVVDAIRKRPTHSNMRQPGFGVGGYCLTKDPLFATLASRDIFGDERDFPFCRQAVALNNAMPLVSVDRLERELGSGSAGPLGQGVECPDRLEGVSEQVETQRLLATRREYVDDSAANRIFARLAHRADPVVTVAHEVVGERLDIDLTAWPRRETGSGDDRPWRHTLRRRRNRGQQDRKSTRLNSSH